MSDILSAVLTLPVRIALILAAIILLMLWVASIIWVYKDAKQRHTSAVLWTIIAIMPIGGLVSYCLLRPPLTKADAEEQNIAIELMSRQLSDYGNCPNCGEHVKEDYVACPRCCAQLRNVCPNCSSPLDPDWQMCPYCATPTSRQPRQNAR